MRLNKNERKIFDVFVRQRNRVLHSKGRDKENLSYFLRLHRFRFHQDFIATIVENKITPIHSNSRDEMKLYARLFSREKRPNTK